MSIYNSQNEYFKTPFGAVPHGQPVTFRLCVPKEFICTTPYLFIWGAGQQAVQIPLVCEERTEQSDNFVLIWQSPAVGAYFYYFDLYTEYRKLFCGAFGEAYITTEQGTPYQLTVYEPDFTTPEHLKGGVLYQIFPDRFFEGNPKQELPFADRIYRADKKGTPYFWPTEYSDGHLNMDYYGGDLVGIQAKLPYLQNLGVTCIYLNPIFEAHANHRYNTANYMKIDPVLGTNDDFKTLCASAKKRGIDIILDGVFSHTGSDSIYFNREGRYPSPGAYHDAQSPYRQWYDFSDEYTCGYRSWWGFKTLPEVCEENPEYRAFICGENGVIDHWMSMGASGFRLDVADELPDDFIAEIRKAIKRHGDDKYLLGEVWEDATNKWSYGQHRTYLLGKGLDAVMNYPFQKAVLSYIKGGDAISCANEIATICEHYPKPALDVLMNFMSTHDTVRALTELVGEPIGEHDRYWQDVERLSPEQASHGQRLVRLAHALIFTLPGIPSVYYGDEVYMQGYKDPFNRGYFPWDVPETALHDMIETLAQLRKEHAAFADGSFHVVRAEGHVLHFERRNEAETVAICINCARERVQEQMLGKDTVIGAFDFAIVTA